RSVHDSDFGSATLEQGDHDRAGCSAGANDCGWPRLRQPAGRAGSEILHETETVRVAALEGPVRRHHDRVDRTNTTRRRIASIDGTQGSFLVRHRYIDAAETQHRHCSERCRELLRPYRQWDVGAVDSILLQPVAMDARRAGMGDRPTHDPCNAAIAAQ